MTLGLVHQRRKQRDRSGRKVFNRLVENNLIRRVSFDEYRQKVQHVYGGPKGALLATCSLISLHVPLGERIFRSRKFDLSGFHSILDVGSGAGQIAKHVLKYADPHAQLTCVDLSHRMLRRARNRIHSNRPCYITADITRLPFQESVFDCVTCGYVLEHLPDPEAGLAEIARVMQPGGRMLLLTTEDNFSGAWTSRVWCCRTYNRNELKKLCASLGLWWNNELWFTPMHRALRAGGICVEIEKRIS
ncbi:MAG: class I SAM-dependent methyltransferase [Pirellulales bacterium]|nr:class I SAM-dependent methyltransferase [Pirellulales bacterium]